MVYNCSVLPQPSGVAEVVYNLIVSLLDVLLEFKKT